MAKWEEVLDIQLDIHDFMVSPVGEHFGAGYFRSAFNHPAVLPDGTTEGNPAWRSADDAAQRGREWARAVGVATFNAEPVWVDPDMMTVVESAVAGFRPEPLAQTDLITPNGLLVLPRSLWLRDVNKSMLSWKAALWYPIRGGIHLTLFHDHREPDDMDKRDDLLIKLYGGDTVPRFLPTHTTNWHWGESLPNMDPTTDVDHLPEAASSHIQLQATWRLLNQYLADNSKQRPPRAFVRRAQKAKLPTEHVTIVRLRRPRQDSEPGEPSIVHWTKRWLVGGHWRWQWYATPKQPNTTCGHIGANGPCRMMGGTHRQIWISPFVKGPEEMPLVPNKARIFELVQ